MKFLSKSYWIYSVPPLPIGNFYLFLYKSIGIQVNKQRLLNTVRDCKSITVEDVVELKKLSQTYPYSQIIHALIAKGCHEHADGEAQKYLHTAAVYATDRKVLKALMVDRLGTLTGKPAKSTPIEKPTPTEVTPPKTTLSEPPITNAPVKQEGEALRREVLHNLELLMESKKPYSSDIEEDEVIKEPSKKKKKKASKKVKTEDKKETTKKAKKKDSSSKSIKKNLQPGRKSTAKEQSEIINKFIQEEPSIGTKSLDKKEEDAPSTDLSEASVSFGEDLISENLAQILVTQGKKGKAIDIYKKLIWKFPQKKAYFASQIEALKK